MPHLCFYKKIIMIPKNYFVLFSLLFLISCQQGNSENPVADPSSVVEDQANFVKYWSSQMNLSSDFIALDTASSEMPKDQFLKQVSTGNYLPVKLKSDTGFVYKLYKLDKPVDNYIRTLLKSIGNQEYKNFQWESKPLPKVNLKDLNGNIYTSENMRGKILVIDFWFIGCVSCVKEMPELNEILKTYKGQDDILFLSIAFDDEDSLRKFSNKINFDFSMISDTSPYLNKKLGINSYSTIVVVDKKGNVSKILDDQYHSLENLRVILKKETSNNAG